MPLARSLAILSAFTPEAPWLGNQELVLETGIPAPSVSRMLRSLVTLGYLHYSPQRRKYRLAAAVLSLGYSAIAHLNVQRVARLEMQSFADASEAYVVLGTRERLDVIVLETCANKPAALDLKLYAGTRLRIASSPMGGHARRITRTRTLLPARQHRAKDGARMAAFTSPDYRGHFAGS